MSIPQDETPRIEFMERLAELEQAQARIREELAALRAAQPIPTQQGTVPSQGVPLKQAEDLKANTAYFSSDQPDTIAVTVISTNDARGVVVQSDQRPGIEVLSESFSGIYAYNKKGGAGVAGQSESSGPGVTGKSYSGSGVYAESIHGRGVDALSSSGTGVYAESKSGRGVDARSPHGPAVYAESTNGTAIEAHGSCGIHAVGGKPLLPLPPSPAAIFAEGGEPYNTGIRATSETGIGVEATSTSGFAVSATSSDNTGVYGEGGVTGVEAKSTHGTGVNATSTSGIGVDATSTSGRAVNATSTSGAGVQAKSTTSYGVVATSDSSFGVHGSSTSGPGVHGSSTSGPAVSAWSTSGIGVEAWGNVVGNGDFAGRFHGNVDVTGNITKSAGTTKIDHPLEHAHKYLSHSVVASAEMKTVYDGVVTTDDNGEAVVVLPDYCTTLNRDFRYQLTVVGQFAQAIVAEEITDNRFTIKTDKPSVKVCWQVTGIRQDRYANANPLEVEEEKPIEERGYYLHPELYSQPRERGIEWARHPERMRQLDQMINKR